jgi:hypothetical protein
MNLNMFFFLSDPHVFLYSDIKFVLEIKLFALYISLLTNFGSFFVKVKFAVDLYTLYFNLKSNIEIAGN